LDNQSSDDSEEFVRQSFPDVDFISASANRVFCSYNEYAGTLHEDFIILLNNDIHVEENFVDPLLDALTQNEDAFFAAPKALHFESGDYEGCRSKLQIRAGLLWGAAIFPGFEKKVNDFGLSMQTGFGGFRRKRLLDLGGFDDLYLPGTVEDADLCFRAYRRGWRGYYCPESTVYHLGQASFKRAFGESGIRRMNRRNLYLFMWKNIRSRRIFIQHVLCLPLHLVKYILLGQWDFLGGFKDALGRLPEALKRRRMTREEKSNVSDRKIFQMSESI